MSIGIEYNMVWYTGRWGLFIMLYPSQKMSVFWIGLKWITGSWLQTRTFIHDSSEIASGHDCDNCPLQPWTQDGHRKICVPSADTWEHWLRARCEPKKSICGHLHAEQSSCVQIETRELSICGHLRASAHLAEMLYFLPARAFRETWILR